MAGVQISTDGPWTPGNEPTAYTPIPESLLTLLSDVLVARRAR